MRCLRFRPAMGLLLILAAPAVGRGEPARVSLPIQVVDADGAPVVGATVTPWALRSSQGHGSWGTVADDRAGFGPESAVTDDDGLATVIYPRFRDWAERTRTLMVSVSVDQPGFAYAGREHIDVPLGDGQPHKITLERGVPIEVRPLVDGAPTKLQRVFVFWSDGRSWNPDHTPEELADGWLRIPAMRPGRGSVLVGRLEGDRVTHVSRITDFDIELGKRPRLEIPLPESQRIEGRLSDNVPRPVKAGRIKVRGLPPSVGDHNRVTWRSWTPVRPDGTFTVDGWPAGEPMQLIAICEGYVAESGSAPAEVENPRDPAKDPFNRPQVFRPTADEAIEVAMTPLVKCVATAVDEDDKPVAGVKVASWPNVGWWNGGSQVYATPLVRGEDLAIKRDYRTAAEKTIPSPFEAKTDGQGRATLWIPAGRESLAVYDDLYELPVFLGRRSQKITLTAGQTTEVTLRVQPIGSERLGEWDKLAGVVFGCSTREGRRICALPRVREQMDDFARRFREAEDPRDPALLRDAYAAVADAFIDAGDAEEAAKWLAKSLEQADLVDQAP